MDKRQAEEDQEEVLQEETSLLQNYLQDGSSGKALVGLPRLGYF